MGRRLTQNDDPEAALQWFDKAQVTLQEVRQRDAGNVSARTYLRNTHWNRAEALLKLDRPAEALKEWDASLTLDDNDPDRSYSRLGRALALAHSGKYEEALGPAEALVGQPDSDTFAVYRAARVFSLAAVAVHRDTKRETSQREKLAEQYAASAVALLRRNFSQGYFKESANVAYLKRDADMAGLRSREDFQNLLRELQE
jgi:tetratricopeptide (TPR) repeat protein